MKNIFLIGGGGHCVSVSDVLEGSKSFRIVGFVDIKPSNKYLSSKYKYLGNDSMIEILVEKYRNVFICIGQIKNSDKRKNIFEKLINLKAKIPTILSENCYVSHESHIDIGTIIMHGAIINANTSIGKNCIINSQALIEHDVVLGSHNHISTGVKVNGNVKIGNGVFIGSGAIIKEGVNIGSNNFIPAGTFITKDLPKK